MSAKPFKASNIPVYISAKSKDELIEKMLKTNLINAKGYNYMAPQREGNSWVVWYYADVYNDKHVDGAFPEGGLDGTTTE